MYYHARGKFFCATVLPGYNDKKIRSPGAYLSRNNGSTYRYTWDAAIASNPDCILITSFNEWWEGTEIEPSINYSTLFINLTREYVERYQQSQSFLFIPAVIISPIVIVATIEFVLICFKKKLKEFFLDTNNV